MQLLCLDFRKKKKERVKKTSCSTWERLAPLAGRLPKQWQHTKPAFFCTAFVSVIVGKFCNRRKKEIQGLKNMWWSAPLLGAGSALAVTLHWLPAWKPSGTGKKQPDTALTQSKCSLCLSLSLHTLPPCFFPFVSSSVRSLSCEVPVQPFCTSLCH